MDVRDPRRRPDRDGRRARHRAGRLGRPLVRRPARARARGARSRSGSAVPCCSTRRSRSCRTSPRSSPSRSAREPVYDSPEDVRRRARATTRDAARARARGRGAALRACSPTAACAGARASRRSISIYGELATDPPPPETLRAPTLLIHAPAYGLVRDEQLAAYADRVETLAVPGHAHGDVGRLRRGRGRGRAVPR